MQVPSHAVRVDSLGPPEIFADESDGNRADIAWPEVCEGHSAVPIKIIRLGNGIREHRRRLHGCETGRRYGDVIDDGSVPPVSPYDPVRDVQGIASTVGMILGVIVHRGEQVISEAHDSRVHTPTSEFGIPNPGLQMLVVVHKLPNLPLGKDRIEH